MRGIYALALCLLPLSSCLAFLSSPLLEVSSGKEWSAPVSDWIGFRGDGSTKGGRRAHFGAHRRETTALLWSVPDVVSDLMPHARLFRLLRGRRHGGFCLVDEKRHCLMLPRWVDVVGLLLALPLQLDFLCSCRIPGVMDPGQGRRGGS